MIKEITVKEPLNKIGSDYLPFQWDLNIYRGCTHNCRYCYALYSHKYLESNNFFADIFVKTNIIEALEKKLSSTRWKGGTINMGGVTDSYQPIERQRKTMTEVLRLMIKHKNPISISTKSDLILRDFDLLCELAKITSVYVAVTITTTDDKLQKILEPGASSSTKRLEVLKAFSDTEVVTGLHMMPILPFITDSHDNLKAIFSNARSTNADQAICGLLNLRGETRKNYLDFIGIKFPHLVVQYRNLYKTGHIDKQYRKELYKYINTLKTKYDYLCDDYEKDNNKNEVKNLGQKRQEQLDLDL